MNHSTLQFPDFFIVSPPPPLTPLPHQQQEAKEYVDQRIIPHRLQIGLGVQNGAHGSLYKCHTLYLEYKSLLHQLQLQQQQQEKVEERQPLRLLLERTQRQLITELRLQQMEFHKLVMLQQSRRNEIILASQRTNIEENSRHMDLIRSVVPNQTNTDHYKNDASTNSALLSSVVVQQLRQRYHQVQQLQSCYQEYDAILQVLYTKDDGKLPTNITTLNLSTTTTSTTAMSMPLLPPPPPQQQPQSSSSSSSSEFHHGNNSNEMLQSTYDALLRDKQMIQNQINNIQQQEIQLRKQQLHLLQQTIQDMKHRVSSVQEN